MADFWFYLSYLSVLVSHFFVLKSFLSLSKRVSLLEELLFDLKLEEVTPDE